MDMTYSRSALRTLRLGSTLVAALLIGCIEAPEPEGVAEAIGALVADFHAQHQFSGVALVSQGDSIVFHGAVGFADVGLGVKNTPSTRFRVASITKIFTSILVLQMADQGLLMLDDPIGRHVDTRGSALGEVVTVRHLLTHTSGLPREYLEGEPDPRREYRLTDLVAAVTESAPSDLSPGGQVAYSNAGFVLLAAAIESITNMKYRDAVKARILDPLGMADSGVEEMPAFVVPGLARGYRLRMGTYIHADRGGMAAARGNGGIYSTAHDLQRLDAALRHGEILSSESQEFMFEQGTGPFAIGWQVGDPPNGYPLDLGRLAWARGANPGGYRAQWTRELEGDVTVILLTNLDSAPRHDLTARIFHILRGSPTAPSPASLGLRVLTTLEDHGDSAAFAQLTTANVSAETRAAAVNELVELGHHRIRAQTAQSAIPLFRLADRAFPETPGIITSLAYAYLESGLWTEAQRLAEQALVISPKDPDARMVLAEATRH